MIHDRALLERLSAFETERFDGEVYRATRVNLDPLAPSTSGGRWAPRGDARAGVPVLYASLDRDGALAEITYHWRQLTPYPTKPAAVHHIGVCVSKSLRLLRGDLADLGVAAVRYNERNYRRTQEIGAAVAFLGCDGLLVPSARWDCDNLVIFADNHGVANRLEVIASENVDWQAWAIDAGLFEDPA